MSFMRTQSREISPRPPIVSHHFPFPFDDAWRSNLSLCEYSSKNCDETEIKLAINRSVDLLFILNLENCYNFFEKDFLKIPEEDFDNYSCFISTIK